MPEICPDCGHRHEGPGLAGICVGCPCPRRAGARELTGEQVHYLRRILTDLSSEARPHPAGHAALSADQRGAYRHALTMLNELLAESAPVGGAA